jgi:homeodomain-containing protein
MRETSPTSAADSGFPGKSFYKWKRRYADHGDAGLCDRPRTPQRSPRATAREVVSKILYLRQHYHFGAGRIAAYLKSVPRGRHRGVIGAPHPDAPRHASAPGKSETPAARQTLAAV